LDLLPHGLFGYDHPIVVIDPIGIAIPEFLVLGAVRHFLVGFPSVMDDEVSGQYHWLRDCQPLFALVNIKSKSFNGFGAQARDFVLTRAAPGAPRDNYFKPAKHSSEVIHEECHEADHSTVESKTRLFGVAG
jgi:hypothetical protein